MNKKIYFLLCFVFSCLSLINAQTINFQDTKGELTVDGSGSANYKVPIALPPGIKDVAPQIALTYSSTANNGLVGYGWNIVGISSINRVGSRLDLDGIIKPIQLNSDDNFSLDGQRLIKQSDNSLRTENFTNLKIVINNGNFSSPDYFIVYSPDGSISYYGNSSNSKGVSEWLITKWIDTNGNTINYDYIKETNVIRINKITWSVNDNINTNYNNTIEFVYKNRIRPESAYIKGVNIINKKLLSNIIVKTNGIQFKKYVLTHETNDLNYEVVKQIQEFNSVNEGANPVIFNYDKTASSFDQYTHFRSSTSEILKDVKLNGDFDGDGDVDFVTNSKMYLNVLANNNLWTGINLPTGFSTFNSLSLNVLDSSNKFSTKQSLANITRTTDGFTNLNVYKLNNNVFSLDYKKKINLNTIDEITECPFSTGYYVNYYYDKKDPVYLNSDFNADGLSDILIIAPPRYKIMGEIERDFDARGNDACNYWAEEELEPARIRILKADRNASTQLGSSDYIDIDTSQLSIPILNKDKYHFQDFDGDGVQELFVVDYKNENSTEYSIFSIKLKNTAPFYEASLLKKATYTGDSRGLIFGDFNGDGKTDMFIPEREDSRNWTLYTSNGEDFLPTVYSNFYLYDTLWEGAPTINRKKYRKYQAVDINNDGKSDFVVSEYESYSESINNRNGRGHVFIKPNLGFTSSNQSTLTFGAEQQSTVNTAYGYEDYIHFIPGNYENGGKKSNFMFIQGNQVWKGAYLKDQSKDSRLISVKESNGTIEQNLEYTELLAKNTAVYKSTNTSVYPFFDIKEMPNTYVVSKQIFKAQGKSKYRLFQYRDLTLNYNGLGILGFKKTAQSGWIVDGINNSTPIWNVSQMDPLKRGVNTISWTFSGTNTNLIDSYTNANLISKITNTYKYELLSDKRFILVPTQKVENDFITNITTTTTNTYDAYHNIASTTEVKSANGQTFKSTTTNTVENLPSSSPYIIGRLKKVVSKVEAYGSSHTRQQEYTYSNNNITKEITTVQNTGSHVTDYTYDSFGNVLTITDNGKIIIGVSESITPRKIENKYDSNGRFVINKKDIEGYESKIEYNILGQVTKTIDKFGVVTSNEYDNWGKLLKVTTSNSSSTPIVTQYQYVRNNDGWNIITFSEQTKDYSAQYFDAVGNNIKNTVKGFSDGQYVSSSTEYDFLGRKLRESQPYFNTPSQWTNYEYDYLLRPIKIIDYTGLIATNSYNGLTITTVEGVRSKKITKDAIGNTSQLVDNGTETINYTYFPHGGVKTTSYGNHVITTDYDVWGRRTSLLDPSVSTIPYTYAYTAFDEIKQEKMPEGTTNYKYDVTGKITEKTTTGKSNISVKYTYDPNIGLLIKEYGTNEGNSFSNEITYDSYFRISNKKEVTPKFAFGKQFVYDEYGRIMNSESYVWDNSNSKRLQTTILNHQYNPFNGELNLLLDISNGVGKVVWKANSKNERGQVLNSTLGELITVENTYDSFGNITNIRNKKGNDWLYNVDYEYYFDNQQNRGLLKRRYDSHFGWEENFTYDNFDRLLSWSSPNGTNYNTYLGDGRIDVNNQVGKYAYSTTAKYKKESIQLNAAGSDYYARRKEQSITYDAFKRPLSISEEGRGNVNFQYGINGGRYFALKQDLLANKTTQKYFSQDGTIDISVDQNGNTKIINYISSPYETPIIYVTELNASLVKTKEGFHYLARDFQGSIMAIFDANAKVVERRLFDPWGNLVKVQDANGNVTEGENAKLIFLDRGYTGHEHFSEVGIIHMNGRIYDPILKQFLSPDNFIQDPENSQSYNRYGYVWNNPLKYTDPSGEVISVGLAIAIGAATGALSYTINAIITGSFNFKDFTKSVLVGAISGAVSFGVGELAQGLMLTTSCGPLVELTAKQIFMNNLLVGGFQMITHGVSQGVIQGVSGGANFGQTFLSAMVSSVVAGGVQGVGNIAGLKDGAFRTILFGTVSGGLASELTGGNFWQGAATGFVVSALNHAAHDLNRHNLLKKLDPYKPTLGEKLARAAMPRAAKLAYDAIALTTGQARHRYGPDAVSIGMGIDGGAVFGVEGSGGYILLLRGEDSAMKMYLDGGFGVTIPSVNATANVSQYFYSGSVKDLSFNTFRGARWSIGVSVDVGLSLGMSYSNSVDGLKKHTHAYSSSAGVGLSIVALGIIATYGSTWINP